MLNLCYLHKSHPSSNLPTKIFHILHFELVLDILVNLTLCHGQVSQKQVMENHKKWSIVVCWFSKTRQKD